MVKIKEGEEESEDEAKKRCKEAEDEAEAKKAKPEEEETEKKPTRRVGGKLIKEEEDEDEDADEDEDSEEEKPWDAKKKGKKKSALKQGPATGQSPEQSTEAATSGVSSTSPNMGVPSQGQDVFVPQSQANVDRTQETPMGKSASPDLTKSPLYLGVMKQLDGIQEAMSKKLEAVQKSMEDRLSNTKKELEKFYEQSFYKAASENVAPEATQALPISKQMEMGKVRFSMK